VLLFTSGCFSPNDEIQHAFSTIDKSLELSNRLLRQEIEGLHSSIDSIRIKSEILAQSSDSIYFLASNANRYIDSLKGVMHRQDTLGADVTVARKFFIFGQEGEKLRIVLMRMYSCANAFPVSSAKRNERERLLLAFQELQVNKQWAKVYFNNSSTAAALTVLQKFQNDYLNLAAFLLRDIRAQLNQ
jgi:hypothetical protein